MLNLFQHLSIDSEMPLYGISRFWIPLIRNDNTHLS
jgi:hypothetical protein